MQVKREHKFEQPDAASLWEVNNIPSDAVRSVVTYVETNEGEILQPDDQVRAPYGIQLSFGVRQVSGTAYFDYWVEEEDTTVVSSDGNVVNITVNQNPRA